MKKIFFILAFLAYLLIVPISFAQTPTPPPTTPVNVCPQNSFLSLCNFNTARFGTIIGTVINFIFVIAIILAVIYLIYGGIKWILSGGDKGAVDTARSHIVAAIIGLIIVFLAFFIINIVAGLFLGTGFNLNNLQLPSLGPTPTPTPTPTT